MTERPTPPKRPGLAEVDINEYGGKRDGERQSLDRRLFMQLLVFDVPPTIDPEEATQALIAALEAREVPAVVYEDAMSPLGLGLLTWSDDPAHFITAVRPCFRDTPLRALVPRDGWAMLGRTYASGYELSLIHI